MSLERRVQIIPANGRFEMPGGNYILFLTATAAVELQMLRDGTSDRFIGVTGGLLLRRIKPYQNIVIIGTAGVSVEVIVGSEVVEKDETDIRLAVTAIAGTISTTIAPSSILSTPDDNALAVSATENIAANLSRKRITIGVLSTELVGVRAQAVGANDASGVEIQPGTSYTFETTASIDVRNNDATNATSYWILEET